MVIQEGFQKLNTNGFRGIFATNVLKYFLHYKPEPELKIGMFVLNSCKDVFLKKLKGLFIPSCSVHILMVLNILNEGSKFINITFHGLNMTFWHQQDPDAEAEFTLALCFTLLLCVSLFGVLIDLWSSDGNSVFDCIVHFQLKNSIASTVRLRPYLFTR